MKNYPTYQINCGRIRLLTIRSETLLKVIDLLYKTIQYREETIHTINTNLVKDSCTIKCVNKLHPQEKITYKIRRINNV